MQYRKALVALLSAILTGVGAAVTDDGLINATEWVNVAIVAVGALHVYVSPNVPGAGTTKAIVAGLSAGLVLLVNLVSESVTPTEWVQLAVAVAGAFGVYLAPNSEPATVDGVRPTGPWKR